MSLLTAATAVRMQWLVPNHNVIIENVLVFMWSVLTKRTHCMRLVKPKQLAQTCQQAYRELWAWYIICGGVHLGYSHGLVFSKCLTHLHHKQTATLVSTPLTLLLVGLKQVSFGHDTSVACLQQKCKSNALAAITHWNIRMLLTSQKRLSYRAAYPCSMHQECRNYAFDATCCLREKVHSGGWLLLMVESCKGVLMRDADTVYEHSNLQDAKQFWKPMGTCNDKSKWRMQPDFECWEEACICTFSYVGAKVLQCPHHGA